MADRFYVECDMQGNFLIHDQDLALFIIFSSEKEMTLIRWAAQVRSGKIEPSHYYANGTIYKIADDSTSIISHDSEYFKIIEQVIKRTYPGTITLAYEDLTKEAL
jgi:hypothetical protein